ncbi:MAG: glycosyltransferase family 2 protein [Thermoanaerobaculia bacterium]
MKQSLTAIVLTLNEEANVGDCLACLSFCDEVVVVDSFSTDRTVEICRSVPGVRVLQRAYRGDSGQRNWAMDQVAGPWMLFLDADERVTPGLAREIERKVLSSGTREECFALRRENVFIDRIIRHSGWANDRVVRLVRKGAVRYPKMRIHADILLPGRKIQALDAPMTHYTFRSLEQYLVKLRRYAVLAAADLHRRGRRAGLPELLFRPLWRFLRQYIVQRGFADGVHGLLVCGLQAYGSFLKWAQLWEWERFERKGIPFELPPGEGET